jgi:hypothetical protein
MKIQHIRIIGNCESCGCDIYENEIYHELASLSQYYKHSELYCDGCWAV